MGERGENIYINGLNAVYINPLGWEPCEIPALRENLAKRYSKVDLVQDNSLYVVTGIHFHTKLGLEFPKNYFFHFPSTYRLDHLPNENIKELLNKYKQKGTALFSDWLNQKTVPFVMIATKSYTNFVGRPIRTEEIIEQDEPDLNEFAQSLNYAYIDFLEQEFKLSNYYDCNLITTKKPRIKICVLKSLNAKADYSPKWNRELSDLATNYEMQNNRSLPDWVEFLDANNQKRLYKKAAGTLYTEAEQAYGIKPTWQIYVLLQRALQFDPTHIGAVEDALSLQKKLTAHDWELIPSNYKPIEPDFLEKALRESKMNVESFEFGLLESMSPTEKAQRLFVLSNSYFQSDPARCIKLLEQALLHNPNHTEAFKDLQVLKAQIKKTQ